MTRSYFSLFFALVSTYSAACTSHAEITEGAPLKGQSAILESPEKPKISRGIGWWPDVVFDKNDTPHIAYCDADGGKLRYATRRENTWAAESPVESDNVGKYPAIAVSSDGVIYIGYYNQDLKKYALAIKKDGQWTSELVARGLEIGMGASIAIDAHELVNLFFYTTNGTFLHARRVEPQRFEKKTLLDATGGFSVRTAIRRQGDQIWVSFIDSRFRNTSLRVATIGPGGELLEEPKVVQKRRGPGWHSGIGQHSGRPEVIFTRSMANTIESATKKENGDWSVVQLAHNVGVMAAEQSAQGVWAIAYQNFADDSVNSGLTLLRGKGKKYEQFLIDPSPNLAHYLDLAINSRGEVLIAYFDGEIRGLKLYDESASATLKVPAIPKQEKAVTNP